MPRSVAPELRWATGEVGWIECCIKDFNRLMVDVRRGEKEVILNEVKNL